MTPLKVVMVQCQALPGANIADAAGVALRLSDQLSAPAEFDFNGILCRAYPGGTVDALLHAWDAVAKQRRHAQGARCHQPRTRKPGMKTAVVLEQIRTEREFQDRKWGEQNHHPFKWLAILHEETGEAAKAALECDGEDYCRELIEVAAVATAAVECYMRLGKPLTRTTENNT